MTSAELELFYAINIHASHPLLDPAMNFVSSSYLWGAVAMLGCIYGFWRYRQKFVRPFLYFVIALSLADFVSYEILKKNFARLRPCHELADARVAAPSCGGRYGLPSNHAANGMAALTLWFLLFPSSIWNLGIIILFLLVGYSRIYLGVHYPSDIALGSVVGTITALLIYHSGERLFPRKS